MGPSLNQYHVPSLLLVVLGLAVIGFGAQVTAPLQTEYYYSVELADNTPSTEDDAVLRYADLTERGQDVFDAARESRENSITRTAFYWESGKLPGIDYYSDTLIPNYVRYDGRYYAFYANTEWGPVLSDVFFGAFLVVGAALLEISRRSLGRDCPRLPSALLAGLVVAFLVAKYGVGIHGTGMQYHVPQYYLWSIPISGLASGLATWRLLSRGGTRAVPS